MIVVAFSVFGTDPLYQAGAVRNAQMYAEHRPDWDLHFYVGKSIPEDVIEAIAKANPRVEIRRMYEKENASATWWRMRSLKEFPNVFMSRDADSIPCARQRAAEDEWLVQDTLYGHVMRDMEYHGAVILAGLWGVKGKGVRPVANHIRDSIEDFWTTDQIELQMRVFPILRRYTMAHIGCSKIYERQSQRRPFKVPRDPGSFVGQGLNVDGSPRHPEHVTPELILTDAEVAASGCFEGRYL